MLPAAWAPEEARTALNADVVTIAVPRFTLRTHIRATDQLPALGIRLATTPAGAEPGPPPRRLHLAFDRPFGIAVLDPGEEVPLFVGWQAETPSDTAD
ncbi:hypothetical protein AMK30_09745 [Streptomyces sp. CB02460]|nr:hypothetical protein AMK30_09745 [Streptomyces sp. CB02460]